MKKQKTALWWLILALILTFVSMVGAYFIQTNMGKVTVKDMRWETPSGHQMSALLFIPNTATATNPAPAVIASHGWYNNREMQDLNFVELARRGYVVASIDMYGHGNSDILLLPEVSKRGTGFYDAVELVASLPYVDKTRIGATGHSNGARAANWAIDEDNKKEIPLIASVLFIGNDATYTDADGNFFNKYKSRDAGVVAGQYDEFFFRVKQADGSRSAPRDYINQKTAQSFLNFGKDPSDESFEKRASYTLYKDVVDGTEATRVIYNPNQIHPWNHFSSNVVGSTIEFFDSTLTSPIPIPADNQLWQWKVFFNTLGLIGFAIFVISFTKVLLQTSFFSSLKAQSEVKPFPAPQGSAKVWFWSSLAVSVLFSGFVFIYLFNWCNAIRPLTLFTQPATFFIGMWSIICGIFALICVYIGYTFFGGKAAASLKERGVCISLPALGKTALLALIVVVSAYALVFIADYLFKVDFRIWVLPLKAFGVDKLPEILLYLPFFFIFYVANSIAFNCFNFIKMGNKQWINIALLALVNGLSAIIIVLIQYLFFFSNGLSFYEVVITGISNITGIWLFPIAIYLPLAAVFTRSLYKETKNPYLGAFIFSLIITIISTTNTLTQLP